MILTTETEQVLHNEIKVRNPHQQRALKLLESDNLRERLMGFALVSTCFHLCDPETQNHIEKKWKLEKNLDEVKKDFVSFCSEKFSKRQF